MDHEELDEELEEISEEVRQMLEEAARSQKPKPSGRMVFSGGFGNQSYSFHYQVSNGITMLMIIANIEVTFAKTASFLALSASDLAKAKLLLHNIKLFAAEIACDFAP